MSAFAALTHHIVEIHGALHELCAKHNMTIAANLADAAAYLKDPVANASKQGAWLQFMATLNDRPTANGLKMREEEIVQMLLRLLQEKGSKQAIAKNAANIATKDPFANVSVKAGPQPSTALPLGAALQAEEHLEATMPAFPSLDPV